MDIWLAKLLFSCSAIIKVTNDLNEDISYFVNLEKYTHTHRETQMLSDKREIKENVRKRRKMGEQSLKHFQDKQNDAPSEPTSEYIHQRATLLLCSQQRLEILI